MMVYYCLNTKKAFSRNIHHATIDDKIRISNDRSLYDELEQRNLLKRSRFAPGFGIHLVKEGQIGLAMLNSTPRFLVPGRHTFISPFSHFLDTVNITDKLIE
ncbi:unnamed protein product [Rotaria magnacalcarata]|uniref:Uncharacterized protein n=2 Tax=Rotaria magnacalcarata TaxID=392030 RepID=A0A8S2QHA2_9BILA|nr:unnamed protein product [Rotaria magnacalcarata]